MRFIAVLIIGVLTCALAHAAELRPAEATVVKKNGESKTFPVFNEGVKKLWVGQTMDDLKAASSIDWTRIVSIDYGTAWRSTDFSRAMGAFNKGNWEKAVEGFTKTLDGKSEKLQVESHLHHAKALAKLKKYDEAIASLQALNSKFKEHRNKVDFVALIGRLYLAKGTPEQATQTAAQLDGLKDWSPRNVASAALLRADIAKKSGKSDEAIAVIQEALTKVDGSLSPSAVSGLVNDLLELLMADEKIDDAIAVGMKNQWWPNDNPDVSASVHLKLSNCYKAKADLKKAFHHAAIACSAKGLSPTFLGKAKGEAKKIVAAIKKANPEDEALIKTYTSALGNL